MNTTVPTKTVTVTTDTGTFTHHKDFERYSSYWTCDRGTFPGAINANNTGLIV